MRLAWIAFLCSLFLMVLGFTTVLTFMIFIVVPTLEMETIIRTECLVKSVKYVTRDVGNVTEARRVEKGDVSKAARADRKDCGAPDVCPPGGRPRNVTSRRNVTVRVTCAFVQVEFEQISDRSKKLGTLYDLEHVKLKSAPTECFCTSCSVYTDKTGRANALTFPEGILSVGDRKKCFYQLTKDPKVHPNSWMLLNTMFWPTIVFIVGFIGTFFSCILLAKEEWKCKKSSILKNEVSSAKLSAPC